MSLAATPEARALAASRATAFAAATYQTDAWVNMWTDATPWIEVANEINRRSQSDPWFVTNCLGEGRDCDILSHAWYHAVNVWCKARFASI